MKCPACQSENTKVIDSRQRGARRVRRRACAQCKKRFTTYEVPVGKGGVPDPGQMRLPFPINVEGRDGRLTPFTRERLMQSITTAHPQAQHGALPLEEILNEIMQGLPPESPVSSVQICETTAEVLALYAPLAAARYLLLHRRPQDAAALRTLLQEMDALLNKADKTE